LPDQDTDAAALVTQALFRPVSMCIPDLSLICEIMLMAEGFQQSKLLSRKFVILYKLCEDLLSQSKHYDWKLRAIKTTLYVAGGMKRQAPHLSEDKVWRWWAVVLLEKRACR
jgi:dynein heavy chain